MADRTLQVAKALGELADALGAAADSLPSCGSRATKQELAAGFALKNGGNLLVSVSFLQGITPAEDPTMYSSITASLGDDLTAARAAMDDAGFVGVVESLGRSLGYEVGPRKRRRLLAEQPTPTCLEEGERQAAGWLFQKLRDTLAGWETLSEEQRTLTGLLCVEVGTWCSAVYQASPGRLAKVAKISRDARKSAAASLVMVTDRLAIFTDERKQWYATVEVPGEVDDAFAAIEVLEGFVAARCSAGLRILGVR